MPSPTRYPCLRRWAGVVLQDFICGPSTNEISMADDVVASCPRLENMNLHRPHARMYFYGIIFGGRVTSGIYFNQRQMLARAHRATSITSTPPALQSPSVDNLQLSWHVCMFSSETKWNWSLPTWGGAPAVKLAWGATWAQTGTSFHWQWEARLQLHACICMRDSHEVGVHGWDINRLPASG